MKREKIRELFSRFHNLNLLVLMEDLHDPSKNMSWTVWVGEGGIRTCPLAHGMSHLSKNQPCRMVFIESMRVPPVEVDHFTTWWDQQHARIDRAAELLDILRDIWLERLADAEAVQDVMVSTEEPAHA